MDQKILLFHLIIFLEGGLQVPGHRQAMLPLLQHRELKYPCKCHV